MAEISIIVPVYKIEAYLHQCVDSILAQTFTDFECILVDDGSPDQCGAICDEYAERDGRIQVIHQGNSGLSAARNAGIDWTIEHSNAKWICFVDSDDVLSSMYLELLHNAATAKNCQVSACLIQRFHKESEIKQTENPLLKNDAAVMDNIEFLRRQVRGEIEMGVVNRLFHISVFRNLRFANGYLHEDIILAGDLLKEPNLIAVLSVPLYFYRQRKNSIVNKQRVQKKCSPDRVYAAGYLLDRAKEAEYPYMHDVLKYAFSFPWSFVDPIYVDFRFRENQSFLVALQELLRAHFKEIQTLSGIDNQRKKRMLLFARSRFLYGFNAYTRLLRVYLYHILKKDPYMDGHGI